jgi:hypothetical protein
MSESSPGTLDPGIHRNDGNPSTSTKWGTNWGRSRAIENFAIQIQNPAPSDATINW